MKILSIDPGYDRTGVAVLECDENSEIKLLYSDCLMTDKKIAFSERLMSIAKNIERIIKKYKPKVCATESLFFNKNQKTAMMVSQIRGMVLYLAAKNKMMFFEYGPLKVKVAVTGYGKSTKDQIIKILPRLISIEKHINYDDEFDAIAIGLTCIAIESKSWKSHR